MQTQGISEQAPRPEFDFEVVLESALLERPKIENAPCQACSHREIINADGVVFLLDRTLCLIACRVSCPQLLIFILEYKRA
jgi:hypothetical protein